MMDSIQRLRRRAAAAGHLSSAPQAVVTTQEEAITIEPPLSARGANDRRSAPFWWGASTPSRTGHQPSRRASSQANWIQDGPVADFQERSAKPAPHKLRSETCACAQRRRDFLSFESGSGVDHIAPLEPAAARLVDAKAHPLEESGRVRVG
ncbi:MAG TPA: DUF3300 domain-containing protein [Roseiarcus sp.]|nr:DUF3300 domain-containing protein [Roseiarcus sp.]